MSRVSTELQSISLGYAIDWFRGVRMDGQEKHKGRERERERNTAFHKKRHSS